MEISLLCFRKWWVLQPCVLRGELHTYVFSLKLLMFMSTTSSQANFISQHSPCQECFPDRSWVEEKWGSGIATEGWSTQGLELCPAIRQNLINQNFLQILVYSILGEFVSFWTLLQSPLPPLSQEILVSTLEKDCK